jgi:hypothetical protein
MRQVRSDWDGQRQGGIHHAPRNRVHAMRQEVELAIRVGWHAVCSIQFTESKSQNPGEHDMSNIAASMSFNPLFLRHDLMIELGRLEMAIDNARHEKAANDTLGQLESRCARINEALSKLPA